MALLAGAAVQASELDFESGTLGKWQTDKPQVWQVSAMNHPSEKAIAACSLGQGEAGTGTLRSPSFTITSTRQAFFIAGADGTAENTNDGESNFFYLKSHPDGEILRKMSPPGTAVYSKAQWDTVDLLDRKVYLELVDGNPGLNPRGFAWIGIAGYHQDEDAVISDPVTRDDLYGVDIDSEAEVVLCRSVPFSLGQKGTLAPHAMIAISNQGDTTRRFEGDKEIIPIGTSAESLYLLGMINSWDFGLAHWGEHPEFWDERPDQIFVGSEIGQLEIRYADGKSDIVPLKIGATAWFVQAWAYGPTHSWTQSVQEPFASRTDYRKILDDSLKLKEQPSNATSSTVPQHFYLAVKPRSEKIESIIIHNNTKLRGRPVVSAITLANPNGKKGLSAFGKRTFSKADLEPQITSSAKHDFSPQLKKLARVLYTRESDLPKKVELIDFPAGIKAAKIRFKGDRFADMLSNIWVANLTTMAEKFKPETGIFWESTPKYPWYGGYNGIGTWAPVGIYYPGVFPRCSDHYASLPLRLVDSPERSLNYIDFVDNG
ncbi:MAG: hypothetical protein DRP64_13950, partial [Verrucomicrobia bacterium]